MAQVSTVQFNGSNAYELLVGEFVSSWPMGAVGLENISVGVQVYSATTGAGVKLTLRSFDSAGDVLSSQDYSYTVTNTSMWERAEKTWVCPTGIDRAELRITALVGTVLFAQPKMANGETVGAYSTNYAPQLTLLTPTGIYTGTLTASQVLVSGSEDLSTRLTVIGAGMATFVKYTDISQPSTTVIDGGNVTTGTIKSSDNSTWINLANGSFSFGSGALAWNGAQMQITGQLRSIGSNRTSQLSDGQFMMLNGTSEVFNMTNLAATKEVYLVMGHAADRVAFARSDVAGSISQTYIAFDRIPERILLFKNTTVYGKLTASGGASVTGDLLITGDLLMTGHTVKAGALNADVIRDSNGKHRVELVSGGFYLRDQLGAVKVWSDSTKTFIQHMANAGTIGVDSGGPFYTTNAGTKKYLT